MTKAIDAAGQIRNSVYFMLICMSALICLGLIMAYSIPAAQVSTNSADGAITLGQRVVWLIIGAIACAIISRINLDRLERNYRWAMYLAVALLLVVFIPGLSMRLNGARRWIHMPMGQAQPSELAKWCLVIFVAGFIRKIGPDLLDLKKGFLTGMAAVGFICGLVIIEPDFGTAMLMGTVAGTMLLVGGARLKHIAVAGAAGLAGFAFLVLHSPERVDRVLAFLDPEKHADTAYQQLQSLIGIGSGGWFGKGLGASGRKLSFLPEANSDFVFAIIGEELGLVGCIAVLVCFALILYHGMRIARLSGNTFRSLLAFGVTFAIGVQALINLAVVTAVAPNKGIVLPFISHGGSSLVAMMMGVGLVLAVARTRLQEEEFAEIAPVAQESVAHA
jgi:cell division protein FtsW